MKRKIFRIENYNDWMFIVLDNDQKLLTNGISSYDVSLYEHFLDIITMNNRLCGIFSNKNTYYVIDLNTNEILFKDTNVYSISKLNDKTLSIVKNIGCENTPIYNIESKKYIDIPDGYEFEQALSNELYVFCIKNDFDTDFYDLDRCIVDSNGKKVFSNLKGWICYENNKIVVKNKEDFIHSFEQDNNDKYASLNYDEVIFSSIQEYGYGINFDKQTIDIFDKDLNLIVKDLDYKKYDLFIDSINCFIVNNYICIIQPIVHYRKKTCRYLILNADKEIIIDSKEFICSPIGNYIQINKGEKSQFLNTITGNIDDLEIDYPIDISTIKDKLNVNSTNSNVKKFLLTHHI